MKKIAILTSGGDAPGMNAAIRGVVRTAVANGCEVLGCIRGYNGLMNGDFIEMTADSVTGIESRGGTMLFSARSTEFRYEEGMQKAIKTCRDNGIEGVVVIGGDGSFRGARDLSLRGLPCVGVSGTIDNDIASSDYTTGYDTALNTIVEMVDRLQDTTESHDRCMVVECMGRGAGYLTLNAGIACGAAVSLVPEFDFDIQKDVIDVIKHSQSLGKKNFIVMVAEGVKDKIGGSSEALAQLIQKETGVEARSMILGHVQRGGRPTLRDRVVGARLGNYAAHLIMNGGGNRVVCYNNDKITDMDIFEALEMKKTIDPDLYRVAKEIAY